MYNKMSICKKLSLYTVLSMNIVYSFSFNEFGKVCATIGAGLVVAGATALGVDWLTTFTDKELIDKVKNDLVLLGASREYVALFKNSLGWNRYSSFVRRDVLNNLSEEFLYAIACANDAKYRDPFPSGVIRDCELIEKDLSFLLKRIDEIQGRQFITEDERYTVIEMRRLVDQVITFQEELGLLKDYLLKHASYFNLAQCGWQANKMYKTDLDLYERYKYDQYTLLQNLDLVICQKYKYARFPYVSYVEDLDSTLSRLLYARNYVAFNYTGMLTWVNQCIDQLRCVRASIENPYQMQLLERDRLQRSAVF